MKKSGYFKCKALIVIIIIKIALIHCKKNAKYGFQQLNSNNFEDLVMQGSKDAWIVAVKGAGKISLKNWIELENQLRGMSVRVGIVNPSKDGAFLKRKGFLSQNKVYSVARVYPYGGPMIKEAAFEDAKSLSEARKAALRSLPDETTFVRGRKLLQEFVNTAYTTSPPRFPVLLFTDKSTAAPLFHAAALKYSKYFNFGVVRNPSEKERQNYQIKSLPAILVMLATVLPDERMTFGGIHYDRNALAYGPLNYLTFTKFLYSVHEKHWKELPNLKLFKGKFRLQEFYIADTTAILETQNKLEQFNEAEDESDDTKQIKEITWENQKLLCTDAALGLCLITFVNGRDRRSYKAVMRELRRIQQLPGMKGKPLHYMWVNSSCYPEYGEVFGLYPETLPSILIVRPKQRLFTVVRRQNVNRESISETVDRILRGEVDMLRYSRFEDMKNTDCLNRDSGETDDTSNSWQTQNTGNKENQKGGADTRKWEL